MNGTANLIKCQVGYVRVRKNAGEKQFLSSSHFVFAVGKFVQNEFLSVVVRNGLLRMFLPILIHTNIYLFSSMRELYTLFVSYQSTSTVTESFCDHTVITVMSSCQKQVMDHHTHYHNTRQGSGLNLLSPVDGLIPQ